MPQRIFKRKSHGTNTHNSDLEESKTEYSSVKSESDASNCGFRVPNRIFVGGLSNNTDEWDIRTKFSKYGHVKFVKIIRDNMGSSKGYGFVTFATEEQAKSIIEKVQITIKGRKLNIAPAIKKQVNQYDSWSFEMSSIESLQEVPSAVSLQEISKYQSKPNISKYTDNSRSIINWNMPYLLEPSGYLGATQIVATEHPSANAQVNYMQSYPALVYIPQYPYQQAAGFTYSTYTGFPDLLPVVPVPMLSNSMNEETK